MREHGIAGYRRRRRVRTTIPEPADQKVPDLLNRDFTAPAPNQRYVGDMSCRRRHEMSYADPRNMPMFSKGVLFCWVDGVMDRHSHNAVSQARMSGLGL